MSAYPYQAPYAPPAADPYAATYGAYAPPPHGYGAPAPYGGADEVRTVFITGFPTDVKERELNNLLRFLPGYEASQMNWKHGQAQGFALFATAMQGRDAIHALGGLVFDDSGTTLRCEMAHKNMYLKEDPTSKRAKYETGYGGGPAYTVPGAAPHMPPGGGAAVAPQGFAPVTNTRDNPPCNTLFIGNLSENVSEAELRGLLGGQKGFKQLKLVRTSRNTSCFCEFEDLPSAQQVHTALQGAVIASSDRGGIRIQYSKNPFGKKRDNSEI